MKKHIIFLAVLFIKVTVFCQEACTEDIWIKSFITNQDANLKNFSLQETETFNCSDLWVKNKDSYIGLIGKNKRRLFISFDSITRDKKNNFRYLVFGKTTVNKTTRIFNGVIEIEEICSFDNFSYGVDDWMKGKILDQGFIKGKYIFKESIKLSSTGIFEGSFITKWYINLKKQLIYDDVENDFDSYSNNQFIGVWKSYKTEKSKICSWGQYRIPCSGDLDIGAAEFMPNPKYFKYGWENYKP
ncbi:hypothetical protein [Aquimarina aggregata]|uniref:hypothetical protein n=1 Tax=Aquimarina aggregata TaxID=1642818 RepID=UPI00248F68B0|nr:hypothetical protein [Aquimarina aggregata]